ncbi:MAG TPA: glycosyltransferase [Solirubrobacteraceae bacterium]|nr:glycosyltransferase [Solirubrobacteraceae bacterium]
MAAGIPERGSDTSPGDRRAAAQRLDVVIVSLGSTAGLRRADEELRDSLARAGAHVTVAHARPPARMRTLMLTDLAWARAARAAAVQALAQARGSPPPAIVYSSTTAALLWPRAGAIRFDAPSAGNRPGRHGLWQRPLERRRLARAPLLLPWSEGALRELGPVEAPDERTLVLPVPVEPSAPGGTAPQPRRDIAAITYAANPAKKGLDRVLAAWRELFAELPAGGPRELLVAGAGERELRSAGIDVSGVPGVCVAGALAPAEYRALLRRARVFVCAPRREDYGLAQLEALADGCLLVTTPAPGPYAALPLARALDARLVSDDLRAALRAALTSPPSGYRARALAALAPFRRDAVDRLVADELLARLRAERPE